MSVCCVCVCVRVCVLMHDGHLVYSLQKVCVYMCVWGGGACEWREREEAREARLQRPVSLYVGVVTFRML